MSQLLGDVPTEYKTLAKNLIDMEKRTNNDLFVPEFKAKLYTCLAHDWIDIDMEEEGFRLLMLAEKICPGYFHKFQKDQMEKDPDYNALVIKLTTMLIALQKENVIK